MLDSSFTVGYMLCLVAQPCPTLWDPMDCSPPGSSVHVDSPGKNMGVGCHTLLQGDLPNPEIKPRFLELQVDSLPSEPPGKPIVINYTSIKINKKLKVQKGEHKGGLIRSYLILLYCLRILEIFSLLSTKVKASD